MTRPKGNVLTPITAVISQGAPFTPAGESMSIPRQIIEQGEEVYRVLDDSLAAFGGAYGDLLIVEPKSVPHTGELVVVRKGDKVYVGRWWAKHGRRDVLDGENRDVLVKGATVLGCVNLIVRGLK